MVVEITREHSLAMAAELTRKFGFLPRSIVWKYLSNSSIASKYRCWKYLVARPEFAIYQSGLTSDHHLMLSNAFRRALGEGVAAGVRPAVYFAHDEYLMDIVMCLKAIGIVAAYWTEQELKMDRALTIQLLGYGSDDKIPDLILDLQGDEKLLRVAVEVERTRKSQRRYRQVAYGYSRMKKLDMLLFGAIDEQTEIAIRSAFDRHQSADARLAVGYFSLDEFVQNSLSSELRIRGKNLAISDLFSRLCAKQWAANKNQESKRENSDNSLSPNRDLENEVA